MFCRGNDRGGWFFFRVTAVCQGALTGVILLTSNTHNASRQPAARMRVANFAVFVGLHGDATLEDEGSQLGVLLLE